MPTKFLPIIVLFVFLALTGCDGGPASTPPAPSASAEKAPSGEPPVQAAPPEAAQETMTEAAQETVTEARPAEAGSAETPTAPENADGGAPVVATVNGIPITRQILESQVELAEADQAAFGRPEELGQEERAAASLARRLEVLSNLITLELACQEAQRLGYAPDDKEVAEAMASLKKEYQRPEILAGILAQYGLTEDDLRGQLIRTLALEKWRENNFLSQIKVGDQEAREFYDQNLDLFRHGDQVRLSQIHLPLPLAGAEAQLKQARSAALAKGEEALRRLGLGHDFGTVAAELSGDPGAAANRGDLGWVEKGQSLPVFDQSVFEMKPGQVSAILESPMGLYIFKVTEARPAGLASFESVKVSIVEYLSGQKLDIVLRAKMAELFQKADIRILDPELKEIYERLSAESGPAPADGEQSGRPAGERDQNP